MFYPAGYSLVGASADSFDKTLQKIIRDLPGFVQEHGASFVAVQGSSGLAAAFAYRAIQGDDVRFVMVRKDGEQAHSQKLVSVGPPLEALPGMRFVFLDDLIDSGSTACRVAEALFDYELAACFCYNGDAEHIRSTSYLRRTISVARSRWDESRGDSVIDYAERNINAPIFKYNAY